MIRTDTDCALLAREPCAKEPVVMIDSNSESWRLAASGKALADRMLQLARVERMSVSTSFLMHAASISRPT